MNGCIDCKVFDGAASTAAVIAFGELERGFRRKRYGPF
jgi:hypothetical protein